MNNSELEKAYDEYEKLLDEKNYLERDLADLGERKGNAPKEEFDKVKERLNIVYNKIEKVGEKIAELARVEKNSTDLSIDDKKTDLDELSRRNKTLPKIIIEFEEREQKIFEGTLPLDGLHMTEEQQKYKIIEMMKAEGIKVANPDDIIITYEGADDNYGISETQTTKFVVKEKKIVPIQYKVTKEEVYRGMYVLDGPGRTSEKEQRERIFNMMREAGIEVGDESSLEIRYEGANDNNGLSDTQTSEVVVYRVTKEELKEVIAYSSNNDKDKLNNDDISIETAKNIRDNEEKIDDEKDLGSEFKSELEEIKNLKEKLDSIINDKEKNRFVSEITEKVAQLEKKVNSVEDDFSKELLEIEKNIQDAKKNLSNDLKRYEASYEKLKSIFDEYNKKRAELGLLTDEELDELNDKYNIAKITENDNSEKIKDEINLLDSYLRVLDRKKKRVKEDIKIASALGLSVSEYKDITSTLRKRKLLNEILNKKGLTDIINIPSKERTKEQKATIKQAKADVLNEIAEFERNSSSKVSALDAIVALYNIDSKVIEAAKPRNIKVKQDELVVINDNTKKLPARINNTASNNGLNNEIPLRAPEDMVIVNEIKQNEKNSERPIYEGVLANDPIRRNDEEIKQAILREMIDNGVDVSSIDDFDLEIEPVEDNNGISDSLYNNYKVYRKEREKSSSDDRQLPAIVDDSKQLPAEIDDSKQLPSVVDDSKQLPAEIDDSKQLPAEIDDSEKLPSVVDDSKQLPAEIDDSKQLPSVVDDSKQLPAEIDDSEKLPSVVDDSKQLPAEIDDSEKLPSVVDDSKQLPAEIDDSKQLPSVVDDSKQLPAEIDDSKQLPSVVDEKNITADDELAFEQGNGLTEKYRIYVDSEDNSICYVPIPTIERFGIADHGRDIKVDGITCNRISLDAVQYIIDNANNNYSPYEVEIRSIPSIEEYSDEDVEERVRILTDTNTGERYARKYTFTRFNLDRDDSTLQRIDGAAWYRISDEDEEFIRNNADNDYSPYVVEDIERELNKTVKPTSVPITSDIEYTTDDVNERVMILTDTNTGERYARNYAFTRFNLDRDDSTLQRVDGAAWYRISDEDEEFIRNNADNDYSPYVVEDIERELNKAVKPTSVPTTSDIEYTTDDVNERVMILTDTNTGERYARNYAFTRFNLDRDDSTLQRVDGAAWYRISDEDEEFIRSNADNDYSPYVVEDIERELNKAVKPTSVPTVSDIEYTTDDVNERVKILIDTNTGERYARNYAFTRFNLDRDDSTLQRVDGAAWYRISDEDEEFIRNNADNDYSPYAVEYVERGLKKPNPASIPSIPNIIPPVPNVIPPVPNVVPPVPNIIPPVPNVVPPVPNIIPPIPNIIPPVPNSTPVPPTGIKITTPPTTAAPTTGIKITTPPTTAAPTTGVKITTSPTTPKPSPEPVPKPDDHSKPHVEEIIYKLTKGLDIHTKDAKRYTASNIKVASRFKNELKSGNYLYNIVHVVPATFKSGVSLFSKLTGKLMTSKRAREAMQELEKRVNDLTDEELEVLFEEYRGTQLKTDMNNQINAMILPKLKEFGMKKVQAYNVTLTNSYSTLFNDLGTINSIDEQLEENIDDELRSQLEAQRKDVYANASKEIRTIISTRNKANNLLSGGIHGLEEDFKAVATKLSYAGMRFAKVSNFDNELQMRLAHEGKALNTALFDKKDEEVVKHFIGLETLYHENTDVRSSVFGTRSEGAKYYSPLAAEFDYRDDPFIRDLFTTVSLTTATISAVNAYRVHQIEQQRIIDAKNQEIDSANGINDSRMDYVHQTANDITGKRQTFSEGMKAQAKQDSVNVANAQERASLDSTNWGFGSQYAPTDDAHHAFFNQNYDNVTSQINDITSRYGQGSITEAQALQELAQIANSSQSTLSQVASDCLSVLKPYAATHPQFDLHAVEESFNYIVSNPDAIVNMNNAAVDVTNLAEGLKGLSAEHVNALSSLPSDMFTTFMAAASSAALAINVSRSMDANMRKGRYGNQVTDMMDEYLNGSEEIEDVSENTRRR